MRSRAAPIRALLAKLALTASIGGLSGATCLGCAAIAQASPSASVSVQDQGSHDGAAVDTDGTQGDFHLAVTGTASGPLMNAVPQYKAS